jgi:hypothetical protein
METQFQYSTCTIHLSIDQIMIREQGKTLFQSVHAVRIMGLRASAQVTLTSIIMTTRKKAQA